MWCITNTQCKYLTRVSSITCDTGNAFLWKELRKCMLDADGMQGTNAWCWRNAGNECLMLEERRERMLDAGGTQGTNAWCWRNAGNECLMRFRISESQIISVYNASNELQYVNRFTYFIQIYEIINDYFSFI